MTQPQIPLPIPRDAGFPQHLHDRLDALRAEMVKTVPWLDALRGHELHYRLAEGKGGWLSIRPKQMVPILRLMTTISTAHKVRGTHRALFSCLIHSRRRRALRRTIWAPSAALTRTVRVLRQTSHWYVTQASAGAGNLCGGMLRDGAHLLLRICVCLGVVGSDCDQPFGDCGD